MTMLEDLREVIKLQREYDNATDRMERSAASVREDTAACNFLRTYATQIEQDARDAERIEWMDDHVTAIVCGEDFISVGNVIGYFREIIDTAMAKESDNG